MKPEESRRIGDISIKNGTKGFSEDWSKGNGNRRSTERRPLPGLKQAFEMLALE